MAITQNGVIYHKDITDALNNKADLGKALTIDLLWANANPASSFASQTVTFNITLEEYKYICIICRHSTVTDIRQINFIKPDANFYALHITRDRFYWRYQCRAFANIIEFGDGMVDSTVNQSYCIPIEVYGVK